MVELLIVMSVIGLLLAMVAPRIDVARIRVDSEIQNLALTMNAAQRLAVLNQHDISIIFDASANAIRVHQDENNDGLVNGGESVRWVEMEDGVTFGRTGAPGFLPTSASPVSFTGKVSGLPALTFRRNGSASEYGGFYITAGGGPAGGLGAEYVRGIEVERSTGQVTCMTYASGSWEVGC